MYIDVETGDYPLTEFDIRARYPNTSFPAGYIPENYKLVVQTPHPAWNPAIELCTEGVPELIGTDWTRTWIVTKLFSNPADEAAALAADAEKKLQFARQEMVCTPFQGRMALSDAGLLSAVETAIAAADEKTKVAWEYALEWRRSSPMIAALSTALNMTDAEIDDLFKAASQIVA